MAPGEIDDTYSYVALGPRVPAVQSRPTPAPGPSGHLRGRRLCAFGGTGRGATRGEAAARGPLRLTQPSGVQLTRVQRKLTG